VGGSACGCGNVLGFGLGNTGNEMIDELLDQERMKIENCNACHMAVFPGEQFIKNGHVYCCETHADSEIHDRLGNVERELAKRVEQELAKRVEAQMNRGTEQGILGPDYAAFGPGSTAFGPGSTATGPVLGFAPLAPMEIPLTPYGEKIAKDRKQLQKIVRLLDSLLANAEEIDSWTRNTGLDLVSQIENIVKDL